MYIVSLWRESVPMGLNSASKEGNLRASDECPLTYVSLSHTHKWTSRSSCSRASRPICGPGHPWGSVSFIHSWLGAEYVHKVCEWLVNDETSFGAGRHLWLLLSGVPLANVNNKRQSGIIRPPDAWGVCLSNHICVMTEAAVNHCLFIMSPKCTCNVVLTLLLPCQRRCVSVCN